MTAPETALPQPSPGEDAPAARGEAPDHLNWTTAGHEQHYVSSASIDANLKVMLASASELVAENGDVIGYQIKTGALHRIIAALEGRVSIPNGLPQILAASPAPAAQAVEPVGWQPISTAPRDGRPVWAKGVNWGDADAGRGFHHCWVWFDRNSGYWRGASVEGEHFEQFEHLREWLAAPPATEPAPEAAPASQEGKP